MSNPKHPPLSAEDKAQLLKASQGIKASIEKAKKIEADIVNLDKSVDDLNKALG